jgi:2-oxoglutarate dehydrogenase E1 component
MRVVNCTTAAQYFHVLRRQAALLRTDPLPLIVLSPKSLLRHPSTLSTPRDLAQGHWQRVIEDAAARERASQIRRLILCSGKIYVDLTTSERHKATKAVAITRIEQLYPFQALELRAAMAGWPNLEEVVWVQEEPENMGAWEAARPVLDALVPEGVRLRAVTRPRSAAPAEGSAARHAVNQEALMRDALKVERSQESGVRRPRS